MPTRCAATFLAIIQISGCMSAEQISGVTPDPAIQEMFRTLASDVSDDQIDTGFFKDIVEINEAMRKKPVELVRQLIWYHAHSGGDVADGMVLFVVVHYGKVSKVHMVEAIAPLLGTSGDAKLEEACSEVAAIIEGAGTAGPDYSYYQNYVDVQMRANQRIDDGLVGHMYRRSPGQALQTFTMVVYHDERRKPLLWARHVVDDALWKRQYGFVPPKEPDEAVTKELEKMAGRNEWWARLYAAEIIRQHPEFGTEELAKRLTDDPHALVQKTAKAIQLPKGK
jgi:hypothetical protein